MNHAGTNELISLDQASQTLSEVCDFDQIKGIRDKAEAVRKYAHSASLGLELQNRATEVKLRAERRAGTLLAQISLRGGDRRSNDHSDRLKLDDLGISQNQSTRWQKEASTPECIFSNYIDEICTGGKELTTAGLMRLAKGFNGNTTTGQYHQQRLNGHVDGHVNGNASNGNASNGNPGTVPLQTLSEPLSGLVFDEVVCDLTNHLDVLDGILQPLYTGTCENLRSEEQRALRYLLAESRQLVDRLRKPD